MAQYYDVVVFSTSEEALTKAVTAKINPDNTVKYMLFRKHCTKLNQFLAKNLNLLGRKLKDIVLLDVTSHLI